MSRWSVECETCDRSVETDNPADAHARGGAHARLYDHDVNVRRA